jgi:hypothetical protein
MIDTGASVSFCSQKVLETLRRHQHLKHQDIKTYARKLVVALGDGSTATAEEGIKINLQFATDDLQAHCAVLPTLPNGIDLILGNDFLSTYDVLIRPARAECSWYSKAQQKHLVIHGCSTIMPIHSAPHRDRNHPDGRADQLRHHILTLGTNADSESDIEIVSSVELGKRLRLFREKAQNKRMKNSELSSQESLKDEVAYVLTTATLLKQVHSAIKADKEKRWQPRLPRQEQTDNASSSKRQRTSSFRKCENTICSKAAIERPCNRHPKRLMMACSAKCHKIAKKQKRESSTSNLASLQPQTDTDMADAEIAAITKSKDFPLPAPSRHMHKRAMPDGSNTGQDKDLPVIQETPSSTTLEKPKARRKIDFHPPFSLRDENITEIKSDQIDTSPLSVQDSMLCSLGKIHEKTSTKRSQNARKTASLCASSKRKLDAYRARPLEPKEGELANENNEMFEEILQSKLPESLIDQTHKSQEAWIKSTLAKDYVCLKPMDGYRDMPVEEMVRIEDKDDLSNCPIPNRNYKIPRALLPSLEKFIVEMKNSGWIEDSTSEFCSPVLIIPKGLPHENKGYRFVVDLRQLNARTKSLQYMVPELGEMWAKLRNAKFISKLDLRHGFWQMGLHPDSRHKTSFSCEYGTFQYRVLPMGLLTASAAFQRWVEGRLKKHNLLWQRVNIGDTYRE